MLNYFADNTATEGLARQSVRGGAMSMIARALVAILQVGSVLFLARLLTPEDYGLVAMVTAITGFPQLLVDLGTRDAIVQRAKITESEVSALFWINLAIGCGFAVVVAACGPLIARFYHEPKLTLITVVSSLTFVLAALMSQHQALLRRAVKFRQLAIIDVVSTLLSIGIVIVMAFRGLGYWALAARPVAQFFFLSLGMWWSCRWIPGKPSFTKGVKDMVKFGMNLIGFSITDFFGKNSQRIVIGRFLGARILGYYQNALLICDNLIDLMVFSLHPLAVATLSKLQNERDEFRQFWAKGLSSVTFYAMPVFAVLAVIGQDAVVLLLGRKWASAGILVTVLALRGIPQSVDRTLGWLYVTSGRTDRWMHWGVFSMCIQLFAVACGLPFGQLGVAVALVVIAYLMFFPGIYYAGKPIEIGISDVMRVVGPQVVGSLAITAIGFTLRYTVLADMHSVLKAALLMVICSVSYLLIVVGLFRVRTPLRVVVSLVHDSLPARFQRFAVWTSAAVPGWGQD